MVGRCRIQGCAAWAAALLAACVAPAQAAPACPAVLQQTLPRLQDEKPVNLCEFAGQVVVVVNTASQCGYTPQYQSLEALYERYRSRGLVVLGFPANDFGAQEPGSNAAIADFCENQFAVRFPMFAKSSVLAKSGARVNPLFAALAVRTGEVPQWNFHKYVIGRGGDVVLSRVSALDPQDPAFLKDIERLLNSK